MLPPVAMDAMDRRMAGGDDDVAAERMRRLREFRARHAGSGVFYRMLDVPYGVEIASEETRRFTSATAVWWAFWPDLCIAIFFGLFWLRFDLWSTWHAMDGLATSLGGGAESMLGPLLAWAKLPPEVAGFVNVAVGVIVRMIAALLPSLVQFRMPYDASRHDAMWMTLWVSIIFDLGTDSVDIRALVPAVVGWLLEATRTADSMVWLSVIGLGILLLFIRNRQWPVWTAMIVVAISCLGWGQAENVLYWVNTGVWTVFASFAAQSIFLIYTAKVWMLFHKGRYLSAVEKAGTAARAS